MLKVADLFYRPQGPYFQSHSAGLMPIGTRAALNTAVFEPWERQDDPWGPWWQAVEDFRAAIGALVNTPAAMVCPQLNLSAGLTKFLWSLPVPDNRPELLLTMQDFPTIGFVAEAARRAGWQPRFLAAEADLTDEQVWLDALTPATGAVILTHVWSNSSMRAPVAAVTEAARARGILSIVDVAQSAGCLPVDVAAWQPDCVIGSSLKYLCGGPGAGWMAIHPDTLPRCHPVDTGWFSHENPFEFDIAHFAEAPDARRFLGGTPSVLPFAVAGHAIPIVAGLGAANVEAHCSALLARFEAGLDPAWIRSETRPAKRGNGLLVAPPDLEGARARLTEAKIAHDERAGALRLSVHAYTLPEDVDAALAAITG